MTSQIFEKVVKTWDRKFLSQGRHVLLFLDNCSSHSTLLQRQLTNIKLVFLPKNCTSVLQPMDQGVIRSLKCHYRRLFCGYLVSLFNAKNVIPNASSVNVLMAMTWVKVAWLKVNAEQIKNCFAKAYFYQNLNDNSETNNEVDKDLQSLLSELGNDDVSVDDYINADNCVIAHESLSTSTQTDDSDTEIDEEENEDEETEDDILKPSISEVMNAMSIISRFYCNEQFVDGKTFDDFQSSLTMFCNKAKKQSLITDYFK